MYIVLDRERSQDVIAFFSSVVKRRLAFLGLIALIANKQETAGVSRATKSGVEILRSKILLLPVTHQTVTATRKIKYSYKSERWNNSHLFFFIYNGKEK